MLENTKDFTLSEWSLLWATFFRMERKYRQMGKDGQRKWTQLKILLWLYSHQVPIRAGDLPQELEVTEEAVLDAIAELFRLSHVIEVGFYKGVVANSKIQQKIQLTNAGRLEIVNILESVKELLSQEAASVSYWKTRGV